MADSNNVYAFQGNSSTLAAGAAAFPISTQTPAASTSLTTKGELLAQWDFSLMADRSFTADGDQSVVPTTGKATTATWKFFDMVAGLGATGKIRIQSGRLEMKGNVDTNAANSIWGLNAGRPARSAAFAINLRSLSTTLTADTLMTSHRYVLEVELEPSFSGGVPANITVPTYHQLHYGFATEMDALVAGTATQGRHMNMAYHVSTGSTSSTHTWHGWSRTGYNVTTGEGAGYIGSSYSPSKYSNTAQAGANGYAAEWTVTTAQKVTVTHDTIRPNATFFPTATSTKAQENSGTAFHLERTINTDTGTTPWLNQASTNDVWAFFTVFRGWAAGGNTTGEYKIRKISIFEARI
jgi:hypothetical protein